MRAHVHEAPIPLNKRLPDKVFSRELETVLGKAIAKKREDRYETAVDLAQALRRCLTNPLASTAARRALPSQPAPAARPAASPVSSAAPATDPDPPLVPVSRGPLIAIGAVLALVLLALGVWLGKMLSG
jgi:serine/threonine-protein kinase